MAKSSCVHLEREPGPVRRRERSPLRRLIEITLASRISTHEPHPNINGDKTNLCRDIFITISLLFPFLFLSLPPPTPDRMRPNDHEGEFNSIVIFVHFSSPLALPSTTRGGGHSAPQLPSLPPSHSLCISTKGYGSGPNHGSPGRLRPLSALNFRRTSTCAVEVTQPSHAFLQRRNRCSIIIFIIDAVVIAGTRHTCACFVLDRKGFKCFPYPPPCTLSKRLFIFMLPDPQRQQREETPSLRSGRIVRVMTPSKPPV